MLEQRVLEFTMEYPCHSQSEEQWLFFSAAAISTTGGGAVISHHLITERKKFEAALKDREERMRTILNTAADAIITIDQRGIITDANPATERLFGYSPVEIIGHQINMLMPPPYCDEHDEYLARYLKSGESRIIGIGREVTGLKKDGTTFPIDLAVSPVDHLGLFTGIIRDLSLRKQLQKQVLDIAVEEQRRIGQELHDGTGQELTGLALFAGTLVELLDQSPQKPREDGTPWQIEEPDLARLRRTAQRLSEGLVAANRHVQQLSHGIMPVQIEGEGLRSALEELASATDAQQDIACQFDSPVPVIVANSSMASQLYRIAQEAVNNALRHGRANRIRISLLQVNDNIVLEVIDNGVGFDPNTLKLARATGRTQGFGLEIMNYRAGMIGGTLRVARLEDGGTMVKCTVPLRGAECP